MEHSAWRQMIENHQIYFPYQFCLNTFSHEMKTMFFWNMSNGPRLTLTFSRVRRNFTPLFVGQLVGWLVGRLIG